MRNKQAIAAIGFGPQANVLIPQPELMAFEDLQKLTQSADFFFFSFDLPPVGINSHSLIFPLSLKNVLHVRVGARKVTCESCEAGLLSNIEKGGQTATLQDEVAHTHQSFALERPLQLKVAQERYVMRGSVIAEQIAALACGVLNEVPLNAHRRPVHECVDASDDDGTVGCVSSDSSFQRDQLR